MKIFAIIFTLVLLLQSCCSDEHQQSQNAAPQDGTKIITLDRTHYTVPTNNIVTVNGKQLLVKGDSLYAKANDGSFVESAAIGFITGNGMIGWIGGGDPLGGMVGSALNSMMNDDD